MIEATKSMEDLWHVLQDKARLFLSPFEDDDVDFALALCSTKDEQRLVQKYVEICRDECGY